MAKLRLSLVVNPIGELVGEFGAGKSSKESTAINVAPSSYGNIGVSRPALVLTPVVFRGGEALPDVSEYH